MLAKTKNIGKQLDNGFLKNLEKQANKNKQTNKKKSEHMAQGKQQLKFESNLSIKHRDNFVTDGRWADRRISISGALLV